jgi:hypothetical protein
MGMGTKHPLEQNDKRRRAPLSLTITVFSMVSSSSMHAVLLIIATLLSLLWSGSMASGGIKKDNELYPW